MLATERVQDIPEPVEHNAVEDRFNIDSSLMDKTEQFRASLRGALPQQQQRFRG
jgi:hypothetical protein